MGSEVCGTGYLKVCHMSYLTFLQQSSSLARDRCEYPVPPTAPLDLTHLSTHSIPLSSLLIHRKKGGDTVLTDAQSFSKASCASQPSSSSSSYQGGRRAGAPLPLHRTCIGTTANHAHRGAPHLCTNVAVSQSRATIWRPLLYDSHFIQVGPVDLSTCSPH